MEAELPNKSVLMIYLHNGLMLRHTSQTATANDVGAQAKR
jgi:hypothetical protein